ncbi:DUF6506 family protein [Latilactobacillus sakei]|uniref:DUF6506 family protein n=1 Tax=Latilactobacillus sakei TaxID=1599 RepID=UPI000B979585|nr:DUF6506 family protein [Latilactobacillus sakei]AST83107.1 hypothetical protein LBS_00730 [Latilactobacillus sakei]AWZ43837.1 hypothetical protein CXB68_01885 [Latilactobacillus sakei]MCE8502489.1 hypothetical protein [Latilactobacillus sakei]QGL61004.1 hypothetical protein GJ664_06750 [Latilactobacillus sakei]QVQ49515.1 hypothetical protein KIK01_03300 [Latilactobacillus sakei subsp. sakei]
MSLENLHKWAFFYFSPAFSPEQNTVINRNQAGTCEMITVGFDPSAKTDGSVIELVLQLKAEGVQFIELCGGFGPTWTTKINEALNYEIPVGAVMYGPEFRQPLFEILQ